jgi:hypothetical protein
MITPTAHDKEEHLLFGGIETETSGQLTSDVLKQAKRETEADWVRVEALCISCHSRTLANLVIVIIFSESFLLKLMIPCHLTESPCRSKPSISNNTIERGIISNSIFHHSQCASRCNSNPVIIHHFLHAILPL